MSTVAKAHVIRRASQSDRKAMAELVEIMQHDLDDNPGEKSNFTLSGNEVEEYCYRLNDPSDNSTVKWHFVKCECGEVDYRHGYEEEAYCPGCRLPQDVHFRLQGKKFSV